MRYFKDILNPYNCLLKKGQFSQSKQAMNKLHHISLNSQFIVVLNDLICFSVRFCGNSLLVLKMRFQAFSFASKKVQRFFSGRKMLMSLLSVPQFFEILIFSQDIWGNVHYISEINLIY